MNENGQDKAIVEARMAEIRRMSDAANEPFHDEQGEIPRMPPLKTDERGRIIPPSPEEFAIRLKISQRVRDAMDKIPYEDSPENDREFFRNMDETRPEGMKLFEGLY